MLTSTAAAAARSSRKAVASSFAQMQQVRNASKDIRFGSDARMQMLAGEVAKRIEASRSSLSSSELVVALDVLTFLRRL